MLISREMSFEDLERNSWSGAIDTIRKVREAGKEDELMDFLEDIFIDDGIPTETQINDLLWFESEWIFEELGIDEEEEEEETE